jgi:hypothetical protein
MSGGDSNLISGFHTCRCNSCTARSPALTTLSRGYNTCGCSDDWTATKYILSPFVVHSNDKTTWCLRPDWTATTACTVCVCVLLEALVTACPLCA